MARDVSTYPTNGTGPTTVTSPLQTCLVRIIFGDPRQGTPAVQLKNQPDCDFWIECSSNDVSDDNGNGEGMSLTIPVPDGSDVLSQWADFPVTSLASFELSFCIYSASSIDENRIFQANASIIGAELRNLIGVLHRPIINNSGRIVGSLTVDILVITPSTVPKVLYGFNPALLGENERQISKGDVQFCWFTGHRGMGKTNSKRLKENTVYSFLEATRNQYVNHVELDVQLTKDGYPVVYHDWFFRPNGRDKDKERSRLAVPIYSLTLREFEDLYESGLRNEELIEPTEDEAKKSLSSVSNNQKVQAFLRKDKLRTLAEVCACLPDDVGIMVEVKYPSPNVQQELSINYPERNEIVDRVLLDLFSVESNARRSLIFLSFEADICTLLALKQNTFPVFFSYCDGRDKPCEMLDPRCISIEQGINFAESQNLQGILFYDQVLKTDPHAIAIAKKKGLEVISYGSNNSNPSWALKQLKLGVDGVIADDVHKLVEETVPVLSRKENTKQSKVPRMELSNGESLLEPEFVKRPEFVKYKLY